jgi:hypothetical protein
LAKWRAEVIVHMAVLGFTVGVSSNCADFYPPLRQAAGTLAATDRINSVLSKNTTE